MRRFVIGTHMFADFRSTVRALAPRTAVVLGSGLGGVTGRFRESASVGFGDVPGLAPTGVHGHAGRLAVGFWGEVPVVLQFGRLHFYEGHSPAVVTAPVRVAADLGVKRLVLTNAAGGLHPHLEPGSLMAIRGHLKLVGRDAWRTLDRGDRGVCEPYCPHLLARLSGVVHGVYAALTGPCYETPAEIRALAACGADAVGMSTAMEAETAAELGLDVAAVSCVTNKAAGLSAATLDHAEVLLNARLAVGQLADVLSRLVA